MRKTLIYLSLVFLAACAPQEPAFIPPPPTDAVVPVKITVTRLPTHPGDRMNMVLLCIDGVKYMVIPGAGITVKYYNDGINDPYPEICVNHPSPQ